MGVLASPQTSFGVRSSKDVCGEARGVYAKPDFKTWDSSQLSLHSKRFRASSSRKYGTRATKKLSRYNLTANAGYAGYSQIEDTPSILQTFLRGKQQGF